MQKVNTVDSFQGKKHTIEIQIKMWRYKYKKYKAKQADIIKLVGQSESLAGLSESLAGLSDLGSNLPRLTTWVGRVLLYPAWHLACTYDVMLKYEQDASQEEF